MTTPKATRLLRMLGSVTDGTSRSVPFDAVVAADQEDSPAPSAPVKR